HWVIAGGESGPKHRPVDPAWILDIRDQCLRANVPFFFKQWGGRTPKTGGRNLDGRTWDGIPPSENRGADPNSDAPGTHTGPHPTPAGGRVSSDATLVF